MPITTWILLLCILGGIGALFWWLIFTTEGVYLGRRVVIWLYDRYARRYDRIKNFDPLWEAETLAQPLIAALEHLPQPAVLDVATGTARLPLLLRTEPDFHGRVIGVDASYQMLKVAHAKFRTSKAYNRSKFSLLHADALHLPFPDASFDAVACLEALEFLPNQSAALRELLRVARPGALILLTNRKGKVTRFLPGKTQPTAEFLHRLRTEFGLTQASSEVWQVEYDLIWAIKAYH